MNNRILKLNTKVSTRSKELECINMLSAYQGKEITVHRSNRLQKEPSLQSTKLSVVCWDA